MLLSSGLIAGGSIAGILIAVLTASRELGEGPKKFVDGLDLSTLVPAGLGTSPLGGLVMFVALTLVLLVVGLRTQVASGVDGDGDLAKRGEISSGSGH